MLLSVVQWPGRTWARRVDMNKPIVPRALGIAIMAISVFGFQASCSTDEDVGDSEVPEEVQGTWHCDLSPFAGSVTFTVLDEFVEVDISHSGACSLYGIHQDTSFSFSEHSDGLGYTCAAEGAFVDGSWTLEYWAWAGNEGEADCQNVPNECYD